MCIHTNCIFHPKPGHVSAIRKGRNIRLAQIALRQKCLINSMSLSTDFKESAVALPFFECRYFFIVVVFPHYTGGLDCFCFLNTLLNAMRFLGPVMITCTPQSPFHQEDIRNLKYWAEFLLTRYCTFS